MQKDSEPLPTSAHAISQDGTEESAAKPFQCSHCTLIFKSKVYLFEHLNKVHGFDVEGALKGAGLKQPGSKEDSPEDKSSSSGSPFSCRHCDFKACHWDVLHKHEKRCPRNSENKKDLGYVNISKNPETKITLTSTNQHNEGAGAKDITSFFSVTSTSKTKCSVNSSNDLKTHKKPLQTITKYFTASSGTNEKPPVKLSDSSVLPDCTQGTLILQESPSNSSGVFKVTAKSMTDLPRMVSNPLFLNDHHLLTDRRPLKPKDESSETVPNNADKRTNDESKEDPPAKKAKSCSIEKSKDDEESIKLVNGDAECPKVYFCKHCSYSDVSIRSVSNHYRNDHPYVRFNSVYIEDPHDQSATFRCLECPVDFLSVPELKRHYRENHPKAPDLFTMQSHKLRLVFRCFVCEFTTNILKTLREHYRETHPTHNVDNSLLYCRYSVTRCQETSSQLNTCERPLERNSPESAYTPCKEVSATLPQLAVSRPADVALYHCNHCNFSHKSVVVMHVHYQKSHPDEPVTIDKIKRSHSASPVMPEKSPNSAKIMENCTPQNNISESGKKAKDKAEPSPQTISLSLVNPVHTPEASKIHVKSPKLKKVESEEDRSKTRKSLTKHKTEVFTEMDSSQDKMFYCQFCCYSSTKIRSVIGHHSAKHAQNGPTTVEELLCYSAKVQKKKLGKEAKASEATPSSDSHTLTDFVSGFNPYQHAEKLFYCQKCNFGNPSLKGVLNHQSKIHRRINSNKECIVRHTALICKEIENSKSHTKELPFATHLPLPIINEGDENSFFCHFCNYRHRTMDQILKHYFKRHRGFEPTAEQINLHTSLVLEKTQKLHLKKAEDFNRATLGIEQSKKPAKCFSVSLPSSVKVSEMQRTLKCSRCSYVTQYLYILRRHMWKVHRSNRTSAEVLRFCFRQGNVEAGYHCDLCVFSHKNAAAVYKHYQEEHTNRKLSLEYISTRLYVGPDICTSKRQKYEVKRTGGILPSQTSVENETKTYSCKACSFKGGSISDITQHYRVVHPWSVKEDGSVPGVKISKKRCSNSQLKDHNEILGSFDAYQVPLEFDASLDSSHEAKESCKAFACSFCPASFYTQHSLSTHCGMKHQGALTKKSERQEKQMQIQTRAHIFKCPHCHYINSNYQGVLTHCQMKHPSLESRADSLHVEKALLKSLDDRLKESGPGYGFKYKGYMCKTCQQIYATSEKLTKHCEKYHKSTMSNILKPAPKTSAVCKIKPSNIYTAQGSVSKASFLRKKIYSVIKCQHCNYSCSTNIALDRHLRIHHRHSSVSPIKDYTYKCVLCSQIYCRRKRLGNHYIKKHGKDAYLEYYVPLYKQVSQKSVPASADHPLTEPPESTSEACESDTMTDKKIVLIYKCPTCPYVNSSYHGTLTHCQMIHPDLVARADELETAEIFVTNMVMCTMGKGSNARGFLCNKCPQIHASLEKLKIHSKRFHDHGEPVASEHSDETEEQPDHSFMNSALEDESEKETSTTKTAEIDPNQQSATPETCQSNALSLQTKEPLFKCHLCTYSGTCRKYLYCHYKYTHKLDALSMFKLLEKYSKRKWRSGKRTEAKSEASAHLECKKCPDLVFNSCKHLIAHYSTFHRSECKMDFIVLSQRSQRSTGSYKCSQCKKLIYGIRNLCVHLDRHRARRMKKAKAAETKASVVITTTPEAKSNEQNELPLSATMEELAQWNMAPGNIFSLPISPLHSPSKPTDQEQPELESRDVKHNCKQCRRTFMSLKGLRSHERSHAALAALKKVDSLPYSALKQNINKYVIFKSGTIRPFLCSICSFRTTVLGLCKSHFIKKHQDVLMGAKETDSQDENCAQWFDKESSYSTEEGNYFLETDEEPEITEKSLYSEPPDVQRQLNQYSLMSQVGLSSKTNPQETMLSEGSLLNCEFCNFNTGHLSSMRRHYLNRHGKKFLRCKDCDFFTSIRKTLEKHMKTGHSTFQSEPTHQKDLRCPFCLYQTKNKNNMIDHIVLHREERVVPIEVRRSKLSHYLQGIVFRCHKCTFTSGSAENLRLHMVKHNDIKPYKCRLCYFDCTRLCDLEAHLSDKHQVVRNHELVGQVSLNQLEATVCKTPEEADGSFSNFEPVNSDHGDFETAEFDTDCSDILHEMVLKNPSDHDISEKTVLHMMESDQDPQEQAGIVLLADTASGQRIKNDGHAKNASVEFENSGDSEKESQKQNPGKHIKFIPTKQEAAEWRSTEYGENATKAHVHTPHIKADQREVMNIKALVEDNILHHIPVLEAESCKNANQDITVKMEQNGENDCENQLLEEQGNVTAHDSKSPVNAEATLALEIKSQKNTIRAQDSLKIEGQPLTCMPSCAQLKRSHEGKFGVRFAICKEEVHSLKNSGRATDSYREMPVMENTFLKKELFPIEFCKGEGGTDHVEQKQDREIEMMFEDKDQHKGQEQEEGGWMKEGDTPHVQGGTATVGTAEVLRPSVAVKKLYTCELCGRTLTNSHELTRHVMRHAI